MARLAKLNPIYQDNEDNAVDQEYRVRIALQMKRAIIFGVALILIGLATFTAVAILSDRDDQLNDMGRSMKSLALVLSKEADATFTLAGSILETVKEEINLSNPGALADGRKLHRILTARRNIINSAMNRPSFAHLFMIGADGFNLANSVSYPAKRINATDRGYFRYHRATPDGGLHISQPRHSKVTNEKVIFLTKRMENSSGTFLGVIGVHLKLRHFDHYYSLLGLPPGGTVTVVRTDGSGVYRFPMVDTFFKTRLGGTKTSAFKKMLETKEGFLLTSQSPYDGFRRVLGYKRSDTYPILNLVSVTNNSVLHGWLEKSIKTAVAAAIGGIVVLVLAIVSYRQIEQLSRAQKLTATDSLTGLHNRRAFDERIEEEWRRAVRRERPLALLFVDIDFFKHYNDHYGHRAGDKCLKSVAKVMGDCVTRAGESVARYGGEEFTIILPETTYEEAEKAAERLVEAVRALKLPHRASPDGKFVTISVGVASMLPGIEDDLEAFIHLADDALYQAKRDGRDRYISGKDIL